MKTKRLLSLLLAVIMVLTVMPITAFAANMSWTWTVTAIGGNYYRSDGSETATNKYTITKHLDNSVPHEIGYKFEWNASAGGNNFNGGWQLCLTVDGAIVERSTAYIYDRNMSTASATWTAPASSHTGTSSHPFVLYLSDYPSTKPSAPAKADVEKLLSVKVECLRPALHGIKTYALGDGDYTIGAVEGTSGSGYTCKITIHAAKYVDKYSTEIGVPHTLNDDSPKVVTLTYNKNTNAWVSPLSSVTFLVKCEEPEPEVPPTKPSGDEIKELLGEAIAVDCINQFAGHSDKSYALIDGSFVVADVSGDKENGYFVDITVQPDKYVAQYNIDVGNGHTLSPENQTAVFKLKYYAETQKWERFSSNGVPFTVDCNAQLQPPTDEELVEIFANGAVKVDCINLFANHGSKLYGLLKGSYELGPITDDFRLVLTVRLQPYVNKYSSDIGRTHSLMENSSGVASFTLQYNADLNKWRLVSGAPVIVYVDCNTLPAGPSADDVKRLFGEAVMIRCVNESASHGDSLYGLLDNGFSTGGVRLDKENGYLVDVTIMPDAYVKQYNKETGAEHKLSPSTQGSKVFTLRLEPHDGALVWVMYEGERLPITYTVTCKKDVKPDPKPRPRPSDDTRPNPTGDLTRRDANPNTGALSAAPAALLTAFGMLGVCAVMTVRRKDE